MWVEPTSEKFQKYLEITNNINRLMKEIHEDTAMFSTFNHKLDHSSFKELVGMGDKIIPYLFHCGMHKGYDWTIFWLLNKITGHNPVPKEFSGPSYRFPYFVIHWTQWFVDSDYYKNDDIYHGLVK